MFDSLKVLLN